RRRPVQEPPRQQVLLRCPPRLPQLRRAASRYLVLEDALERVDRRMKRRARRTIHPLAVPAALLHLVVDEPLRKARHVLPQPGAIRERVRIDAAVDLTVPEGQVLVLPARVAPQPLARVAENGCRHAPLAQSVQRPGRRRPRLTRVLRSLRPPEIEFGRAVRATRPLTISIL